MQELRAIDVVSSYRNFVRMNAVTFKTLLNMVAHLIFRKDTNMREAIPPGERLALTLRFLATSEVVLGLYDTVRVLQSVLCITTKDRNCVHVTL